MRREKGEVNARSTLPQILRELGEWFARTPGFSGYATEPVRT